MLIFKILNEVLRFFQVLVSLFLFFGSIRMSLGHNEYISVLSTIGFIGAAHLFSCLVVFQFRKNLLEEQRLAHQTAALHSAETAGKCMIPV